MPQMAPMNWILLYCFFIMIFILFNFLNYYLFLYKINNMTSKLIKTNLMNWMW